MPTPYNPLSICNVIAGLCVMDVEDRAAKIVLHPTCSRHPLTMLLHARFYLILCIASFFEMLCGGLGRCVTVGQYVDSQTRMGKAVCTVRS